MADTQTTSSYPRTLWSLAEWRCELRATGHLRLYQGSALISEFQPKTLGSVREYSDIWRAAVADIQRPKVGRDR